jgi:hypothetical protein
MLEKPHHHFVGSAVLLIGKVIADRSSDNGPAFFNEEIRGSEIYYAGRNVFQHATDAAREQEMDVITFIRSWCTKHHFREATLYEISGHYPFPLPEEIPRTIRVRRIYTDKEPVELGMVRLQERWQDDHPPETPYCLDPVWKSDVATKSNEGHSLFHCF